MALNYKKLNSKMINLIMIGFAIVLVVIAKNSCKDFFSNINLSDNNLTDIGKMGFAQIARNNFYNRPIPEQLYQRYQLPSYQYMGDVNRTQHIPKNPHFNPASFYDVNSNMNQQPMNYPKQMYPAKAPWYPQSGRPCDEGTCGATGTCKNGVCHRNDEYKEGKTLFNIKTTE